MTIIATIEGPKGSGKSTLALDLAEKFNAYHVRFDENRFMTRKLLQDFAHDDHYYVLERGQLSSMIYGWLRDAEYDARIYGESLQTVWRPSSLQDFRLINELSKINLVLTADTQTLLNRIHSRDVEISKGATAQEYSELDSTRQMYEMWSEMFQSLGLSNFKTLDTTRVKYDDVLSAVTAYVDMSMKV